MMNKEIEQIVNELENDINAISIESHTGGYEDRENALETLNKLKLKLFSIPVVSKCIDCGKNHAEMCGSCVQDIAQGTAEQAIGSIR